jgi:transcriptional regulator with XRE-family HTH domain
MDIEEEYDAQPFWDRYRDLVKKDLPVILRTQIKQSTLSTWRSKKKFPRADMAVKIAKALNTSVEYLVTGEGQEHEVYTPWAMAVAQTVDKLNETGKKIVFDVAKGLETQYPLENLSSTRVAN